MQRSNSVLSFLLVLVLIVSIQPAVYAAEATGFSDVRADAWYASAVEYCVEHGLMTGTGADSFSPDTPMSRAMLATVLYRMAGNPEITGTSEFSDVPQDAWYTNAATWAARSGIVSGYGSGLFGVNDLLTREQVVTILWRYSGSPAANDTTLAFSDASGISAYATEAVAWAKGLGLMGGKPGNRFDPNGPATRAEIAVVLMNHAQADHATPQSSITAITITVGGTSFTAKLYDNNTAQAFLARLPMTLTLSELNGNEKYSNLPDNLPMDSQRVENIRAGDLMLYGSDCLVLFYESFSTAYSYTKLGYLEDASGLAAALGNGSVVVTFTLR